MFKNQIVFRSESPMAIGAQGVYTRSSGAKVRATVTEVTPHIRLTDEYGYTFILAGRWTAPPVMPALSEEEREARDAETRAYFRRWGTAGE